MSKELIVSSGPHETKVAILEEDQVVEVYFEREQRYGLAGSIHKGRVTRVLPGMQSAFVDVGLDRDAFLYVSDFFEDNDEYDRVVTTVEDKVVKMQEKGELVAPASEAEVEAEAVAEPAAAPAVEPEAAPVPRRIEAPRAVEPTGDRDRFGRRGGRRGRRRGGSGFPESKFAPAGRGFAPRRAAEPEPEAAYPPAPPPAATDASDFEVLPGESLAKYRGGGHAEEVRERWEPRPAAEPALVQPEELERPAVAEPERVEREEAAEPAVVSEPEAVEAAPAAAVDPVPEAEEEPAFELIEDTLEAEPAASVEEAMRAAEEVPSPTDEDAAAMGTEAEGAASDEELQPGNVQEASVRERTAGRRNLQRGGGRRARRRGRGEGRDGREAPRERRPGDRPAPVVVETAPVGRPAEASISDLLREGQEIIVQIAKEPIGKKGARITSHIALPGRYLVYMPTVDHVGVSRKIQSDEERQRLKRVVQGHRVGMPGGFIVRTAGEGHSEDEIRADMTFLYNLWLDMRQKAERRSAPALIHHDLELVERILRDQLTESFKNVWVDSQEDYERILHFVERFQPGLVGRVKLYTRSKPIFDEFGVSEEIEKALRPKVWLKSGGYIVINQTEALVAIDVNTGKYVGKSNRLEDTIVKTNVDAVKEIVRQIRLRDLGGIIVIDFIDMDERKNRQKVMQALDEALREDRAPSKILQFNDFGLVAITRKRVKQSLERTLCSTCSYCEGAGFVKSPETMIQEILIEARKIGRSGDEKRSRDIVLRVNPEVARVLKSRDNSYLEEMEALLGRPVLVKSDPLLHQEKFDFD
jgi:ribonuclease G